MILKKGMILKKITKKTRQNYVYFTSLKKNVSIDICLKITAVSNFS